jgi:N-acyl-D-aspartate/D-glutamate deacylase
MHDLVIRGGTVVDGTGAVPRRADVAVDGDRITLVGDVGDRGREEIDANGAWVTPGFVDVHTHLDAQVAWDPDATSSCWHGVTSVVLGNCGVTFAPVRPGQERWLAELMESVEDIPADSILAGLSFEWETYGEYLAAIDALPKGVNVGGMVGHCAVRHYAMGERSLDEAAATDEDIATMCELVDEAMRSGALGFSTSRTLLHRVPDGRPVPGTWADERELLAIADVLGNLGRGVYEVAPRFERPGEEYEGTRAEVHWMAEISRRTARPVTFGLAQSNAGPELYRKILELVDEEAAAGGELTPQTTARGIGLLFGMQHRTFFDRAPEWAALQPLPLDARLAALRDDTRRAELVRAASDRNTPSLDWRGVYVLSPGAVDYSADPETSLAAHAERHGESIVEAFVRISLETGGRALFNYPFLNQRMDAVEELLDHPRVAIGLGDSGAHVGLIMDASLPTWFLLHWVRDQRKYPLEHAVRRMTSETARLFGVTDRGVVRTGAFADVNVFDLDALALHLPEYVYDFPAGAGRYVQRADGYLATVVNGRVFVRDGEPTGAHAGVTLRSGNSAKSPRALPEI